MELIFELIFLGTESVSTLIVVETNRSTTMKTKARGYNRAFNGSFTGMQVDNDINRN